MGWGSVFGGGLSAAGSIASGLLSKGSSGPSYQHQLDMQLNDTKLRSINQPSWLVEGAKRAGLHPLAVLGMNMGSGQAYSVGDSGYQDTSWLNDAGQGIARAAGALVDRKTRAQQEAYNEAKMGLDLENAKLQNELIQSNIKVNEFDMLRQAARDAERAINNQQQVPPFPVGRNGAVIDGQGDSTTSSLFKVKPAELVANDPQRFAAEAGSVPEIRFSRTSDGGYAPMRSQALEEALEDDWLGSVGWNLRNRLAPNLYDASDAAPPDSYLPSREYEWVFNIPKQAWYAIKKDRGFFEYPSKKYLP